MKKFLFLTVLFLFSCKVVKPVTISGEMTSPFISVVDYYVDGDKSWSPAFRRAIKSAQTTGNKSVHVPSGEYLINEQLNLPKDIDLIGESMSNTIIKASKGNYSEAIIRASGGDVKKLSAKVTKPIKSFDRVIELQNIGSIRAGDVLLLRSNKKNSWGAGFEKGEYIKVQSVSKKGITIFGQVYDDYSRNEVEIYSYKGTRSTIKNLTVIGLPSKMLACIKVESGLENDIRNLKLVGSGYAGLVSILGFNQLYDNIHAEKSEDDNGKGYSYGINIGNSQNIKLSNCNLYGVRHGLTFGGAGVLKIPNRFNTCINSTISSTINYAASFHPNTEYCSYISCNILGGALIRGKSNKIDGCTIFNLKNETTRSNEHVIHFAPSVLDLNHIISNNRLILQKSKSEMLISYQDNKVNNTEDGVITIKDNVMKIYNDNITNKLEPIINFNFMNESIKNGLLFKGNQVSSSKGKNLFQLRSFSDKNFDNLIIDNNIFSNVKIHIESVNSCVIKNNLMNDHDGYAISLHQRNKKDILKEDVFIANNKFKTKESRHIYIIGSENYTNRVSISNNDFSVEESRNKKKVMSISNIKMLVCSNNTFGNHPDGKAKEFASLSKIKSMNQ